MELLEIDCPNVLMPSIFEAESEQETLPCSTELEGELKKDLWSFGFFWYEVARQFSTVDQLYRALGDIRQLIKDHKEKFIPLTQDYSNYKVELNDNRGLSGSYFLTDNEGRRRYVVKPMDEDAGCIHCPGYATPFIMSPLRENIPLYLASMREVLASLIAERIGVGSVVPKTTLGIIESDVFHDLSEEVSLEELEKYFQEMGPTEKAKLCSVQKYVEGSKSLFEAIHELEMSGLSDQEIKMRFDQDTFEDANILLWTSFDNDGHMGNFLVYPKGVDEIGNEILGIKKIDNGLAFPDKNKQLRNNLSYLPNAQEGLSERAKNIIAAIDVDELSNLFEKMGLDSAIDAMKQRIPILQSLAKTDGMTIKEINSHMSKIGRKK